MDDGEDIKREMLTMIADARRNFLRAVEDLLLDGERLGNSLAPAIGEVSAHQALDAWKQEMIKRLSYTDPR